MTFTYWFFKNLAKLLAKIFFRFRVIHPERLPQTGGLILAANHQSYFDPPLVGICSRRAVHYLARRTARASSSSPRARARATAICSPARPASAS
jgi:1-acyl-sn-glycerol-3-phosphate acyltransferase